MSHYYCRGGQRQKRIAPARFGCLELVFHSLLQIRLTDLATERFYIDLRIFLCWQYLEC